MTRSRSGAVVSALGAVFIAAVITLSACTPAPSRCFASAGWRGGASRIPCSSQGAAPSAR